MKQILLALAIIALPIVIYAGNECVVVSVSLYNSVGVGHVIPETDIVTGQHSRPCATVTVKNTSAGSRLSDKIIAKFEDGKTKSKSFESDRIAVGQLYTNNICWSRKSELDSIDCEF